MAEIVVTRPSRLKENSNTSKPASARLTFQKAYKKLAEKAEELVPKTWWRDGFANDLLLLSHNDKEGPSGSLISTQKFVIRNCETSTSV